VGAEQSRTEQNRAGLSLLLDST